MGTVSRISDIINSNIQAILDRAEEPEKVVRLMIAKIQETLAGVRSRAAKAIADKKQLDRRLRRLESVAAEWQRKAEQALVNSREDLARSALREKIRITEKIDATGNAVGGAVETIARFDDQITKLYRKLGEARARHKVLYRARRPVATPPPEEGIRGGLGKRFDQALRRMEGIEQRLDSTEGVVEAYDLGTGGTLADEFEALELDDEIMAELAALKKSVAKPDRDPDAGPGAGRDTV